MKDCGINGEYERCWSQAAEGFALRRQDGWRSVTLGWLPRIEPRKAAANIRTQEEQET